MSFYRALLAAFTAVVIASPVFADDSVQNADENAAPAMMQTAENDTTGAAATDQSVTTTDTTTTTTSTTSSINLNRASAKELMTVKGINASKARAIVAYRKKHGQFKATDDLVKVKGFSKLKPAALRAIEVQLTVD